MNTTVAEWLPPAGAPVRTGAASFAAAMIAKAAGSPREPVAVILDSPKSRLGVLLAPQTDDAPDSIDATVAAVLPALYPEWLGDRSFCETHDVRFPYVVGEMANGLTTTRMVIEAARAGFLGFFGAAGLEPARIEDAVAQLSRELGADSSWGSNLIHSPQEPALEDATVDVYLRRGVPRVSASAFMRLTLPVVRYAAAGLTADAGGGVRRRHHLFAKISRPETARYFLAPAPREMLDELVAGRSSRAGRPSSPGACRWPRTSPSRPTPAGTPTTGPSPPSSRASPACATDLAAAARLRAPGAPRRRGGLGTPTAVAAAFALGAAYVLTGSVNQAAVESGLAASGRALLAQAGVADVVMAPAADMFELGVKVQVLKRGTMFAARARQLRSSTRPTTRSRRSPPASARASRRTVFQRRSTRSRADRALLGARDPRQNERAAPATRSTAWRCASAGISAGRAAGPSRTTRRAGPTTRSGAARPWARSTTGCAARSSRPARRTVAQIARNLLEGAIAVTRAQQLRACGVAVPAGAFDVAPRPLA